jgi:Phage minor capsid protein 2
MADFREIPTPNYEYSISRLVGYYKTAVREIMRELERVDLTDFQRANALATLKSISEILAELDENATEWVEQNIPVAVRDGVAGTIYALGVVETLEQAHNIVKFNRLNKTLIEAVVADTQSDLLQVTQNMDRKIKVAVRQAVAESMRLNLTQGINATRVLKADVVAEMRKRLGDAVNTGIVDSTSRRWRPEVYAEMVTRTKMMLAHREATRNEAIARGAYYGVISSHNAADACRNWERKIVRLTPDTPGDFPYIDDLPRKEIFHPNCKHLVTPARRLDRLPDELKSINGII